MKKKKKQKAKEASKGQKPKQLNQPSAKAPSAPKAGKPKLPPDVTESPQHEEHIDLRKVKPYDEWLKAYLRVSDDRGDFLGNKDLENEVILLCTKLASVDPAKETDLNGLIETVKETLVRYASTVNFSENISFGITTKYRIREGILLRHLKLLVTKGLKENWTEWFKKNFRPSLFRSAEDYMRIAAVPNALKYAVFGKELILAILRQLPDTETSDPIGDFLSANGVDFTQEAEADPQEIRLKADIAINLRRLTNEGLAEVPSDKVEAFVRAGNDIASKHIRELKIVKEKGEDLGKFMDGLIASDGKVEPIMTPERKAQQFKGALLTFIEKAGEAVKDRAYVREIDPALLRELKKIVDALERKISKKRTK
jgi:hypothetical protein